ncbi:hypothetical protein, conserved [Leishmania tarentolae]|uniref:Thioredoxin domain-containing protein n=1 Tax=Leishmania tarentolae TaxID=5689 RepID=A0A640KK52_LEITA|nr:hypothetical protein, conserved [Leishmania tarentolae]
MMEKAHARNSHVVSWHTSRGGGKRPCVRACAGDRPGIRRDSALCVAVSVHCIPPPLLSSDMYVGEEKRRTAGARERVQETTLLHFPPHPLIEQLPQNGLAAHRPPLPFLPVRRQAVLHTTRNGAPSHKSTLHIPAPVFIAAFLSYTLALTHPHTPPLNKFSSQTSFFSMASRKARTFSRLALTFVVTFIVIFLIAVPPLHARGSSDSDIPSREMESVEEVHLGNYYDLVGHDQFVLLQFYADWCAYCREFSSLYDEFGQYVRIRPELGGRLLVGKVNGPKETRLQRRYKISGYPTVILVPPNKHAGPEFIDDRNFHQLLDFVQSEMAKAEYAITE